MVKASAQTIRVLSSLFLHYNMYHFLIGECFHAWKEMCHLGKVISHYRNGVKTLGMREIYNEIPRDRLPETNLNWFMSKEIFINDVHLKYKHNHVKLTNMRSLE